MSEWKKVVAELFCDSVRDGTHDTPKQVECGHKLVTAKHINNGQIDLTEAYLISESDYLKINERSKVEKWDVLMSMIGNGLGKSAVVKDNPQYAIKNLALFKIGDEVKAKWLHYYLSSKAGQGFIYNSLQGSGQPFISLSLLRKFPIPVPDDEKIMQDIVGVLSRYDSLIENYQKQIKLLEEAAQRLYKEWFVDLRFPGYENTKIVDGVPEGWEKTNVNNILTFHRGYDLTHKEFVDGPYPVVGSTSIIGYHNKYKIEGPGVVTGRSGSLGVYQLIWDNYWPHNTSLYISDFKDHNVFYIYCLLKTVDFTTLNSGGAIPSLNRNTLSSISVMEPPMNLQAKFSEIVMPLFKRQRHLQSQVLLLTEARDRLLPKLMSGEISVETAQSVTSGLEVRKEQTGSPKPSDS